MGASETRFLFVYGTLRSSSSNPFARLLRRGAELTGKGTAQGKLYRVAEYPGMIPSRNAGDTVYGEVYELKRGNLLSVLDRYEGRRFERRMVRVRLENGERLIAFAWVYRGPVRAGRRIPSGRG